MFKISSNEIVILNDVIKYKGGEIMNVFEVRLKLYILKDISISDLQNSLCKFIDGAFLKDDELSKFHEKNMYKNYCFDGLYPACKDGVYKKGEIYVLTMRTTEIKLANFFANSLVNEYNQEFKGLTSEQRIIPKKIIGKIYNLTPAILKDENGYWKNNLSFKDFERRLKENLIKKYNSCMNMKIDEDFELYNSILIKNNKPIAVNYKDIKFLGDKLEIQVSDNEQAQELIYMALGTGILEANGRGFGFLNYRWI